MARNSIHQKAKCLGSNRSKNSTIVTRNRNKRTLVITHNRKPRYDKMMLVPQLKDKLMPIHMQKKCNKCLIC